MIKLVFAGVALAVAIAPMWWVAGRVQTENGRPFFRLLCATGLAIVGYITFINIPGRVVGNSTTLASVYLALSAVAALWLWRSRPSETSLRPLWSTWRDWLGWVGAALAFGFPQWLLTVSSPYWDETASSAIHITAPNQFAEGVFPPRHNALPDVVIKYHYASTILAGTVRWLTGWTANASIDIVSTCLWLFAFLFVVFWLRDLAFSRAASLWGACATLIGGGLMWMYLRTVEAYQGFEIAPGPTSLLYSYRTDSSVVSNWISTLAVPSAHLRNSDGSVSNLPWDIAAQFQQHGVGIGIPMTVFALYLFVRWRTRDDGRPLLLALTIATFSVLFLCHAVFGGVAAVTAGLVLLFDWLRAPTRRGFMDGLAFGLGVAVVALAHGGFLATGAQYGSSGDVLTFRGRFGYPVGGVSGFLNWNLAGFGIPLLLAIAALWSAFRRGIEASAVDGGEVTSARRARRVTFIVVAVFAGFSYLVPQLTFYSSETIGVEQFTEISKFFFSAHLGFALLSVFGIAAYPRALGWKVLVPALIAMAITPVSFALVHATELRTVTQADSTKTRERALIGFYRAPYFRHSIEQQMGDTLRVLKTSNREVFFDASADERKHGYLSELLVFGGSMFTLTPSRYERTGSGFRLSQEVVAQRFVQNSRMARLRPGAAEDCACTWYYTRPRVDMALVPTVVASRYDKLVAEGYLTARRVGADRVLYSIDKPTADLDRDLHKYWRPRMIMQARHDWDGDGRGDLMFFDYINGRMLIGSQVVEFPPSMKEEIPIVLVGHFPGDRRVDLHVGRMKDTEYRLGVRIEDLFEQSAWSWAYRASATGNWDPAYDRWLWTDDIPLVADLDRDGYDTHLAYRASSGEWFVAPERAIPGPTLNAQQLPVPFAGRFIAGSSGDIAVWSQTTGDFVLQSVADGRKVEFRWGSGHPTDVLVPGDYTGDGRDEIALYNRNNQFWYWREAPTGAITQFQFGTRTAVPLPADYNNDGRVDAAYWEPAQGKIYVTFTAGRSIDLTITVPPNTIPAFVNMF